MPWNPRRRAYAPPPPMPDFFGRWTRRGDHLAIEHPMSGDRIEVTLSALRGSRAEAEIARIAAAPWIDARDVEALRRIAGLSA